MATEQVSGKARKATGTDSADQLKDAVQQLVTTMAGRAASTVTGKVEATAGRLNDYASGGGDGGGLLSAVTGAGLSRIGGKLREAVGAGGGGKGGKLRVTNIVEAIDVGAPVDVTYDQWTRFTDFPSFMKKVENVEQVSDEKLVWKAQVFWSHRSWEATILDQVPGERIVWRSRGDKGHVDGAVTFHELAPQLTRVVLVLEYHPQGLFERTGNLWRAQGRRARLELKHFQRHVMTHSVLHPDEVEGWRGEIQDGEVVDGPEDTEDTEETGEDQEPDETEAPGEPEPARPRRRTRRREPKTGTRTRATRGGRS
nr:SRPBCC family protein [Qaidamihabitans albus]